MTREFADLLDAAKASCALWSRDEAMQATALPTALMDTVLEHIADGGSDQPQALARECIEHVRDLVLELEASDEGARLLSHMSRFNPSGAVQ